MRVKMKTQSTGPKGNREINVEYDIADEAEAKALVDGGFADEVKVPAPAKVAKAGKAGKPDKPGTETSEAEEVEEVEEVASTKEVEVATKPEPENAAARTKAPTKRRER